MINAKRLFGNSAATGDAEIGTAEAPNPVIDWNDMAITTALSFNEGTFAMPNPPKVRKMKRKQPWIPLCGLLVLLSRIVCVAAFGGTLVAQRVALVGTGDPNIDVPAVQAAVDLGGTVTLKGHFSFNRPPTAPLGAIYNRMVTVSKNVVISGSRDANGDLPVIEGGDWPFLVDAGSAHVTIQRLHFVSPSSGAIWVYSVGGIVITDCKIERIQPTAELATESALLPPTAAAIFVGTDPHIPSATHPGTPENFSGTLAILNNNIDMAAPPADLSLGILMFSVGRSPDKEVNILVSGNTIMNITEPAINFRVVGGRAYALRNLIITGNVMGGATNPDALRVVGSGSYLIAHNTINCGWMDGTATGINVIGQPPPMTPAANAVIVDNEVTMSAPEGVAFTSNSAAIEIRGFAQGNSVLKNKIGGRANAGLAIVDQNGGIPSGNSLALDHLADFKAALTDIFIDQGVSDTLVLEHAASMVDQGIGTVAMPPE